MYTLFELGDSLFTYILLLPHLYRMDCQNGLADLLTSTLTESQYDVLLAAFAAACRVHPHRRNWCMNFTERR